MREYFQTVSDTSDDFRALYITRQGSAEQEVICTNVTEPSATEAEGEFGDPETTLAFASGQDLTYLREGDIVQTENAGLKDATGIYLTGLSGNFYVSAVEINGKIIANENASDKINLGPYTSNATGSSDNLLRWHNGETASEDGSQTEYGAADTYWRPTPTVDGSGRVELFWTIPVDIQTLRIQCAVGSGQVGDVAQVFERQTNELIMTTDPLQTQGLRWIAANIDRSRAVTITDTSLVASNVLVVIGGLGKVQMDQEINQVIIKTLSLVRDWRG